MRIAEREEGGESRSGGRCRLLVGGGEGARGGGGGLVEQENGVGDDARRCGGWAVLTALGPGIGGAGGGGVGGCVGGMV